MTTNNDNSTYDVSSWDGIFKDLDACGVDDGYPPGTKGAKEWESKHPGRKVVDWLGRDENHPMYMPAMDEDDSSIYPREYREKVDALNKKCNDLGITKRAFTYEGGLNLPELTDKEIETIPDEILNADGELMAYYKV